MEKQHKIKIRLKEIFILLLVGYFTFYVPMIIQTIQYIVVEDKFPLALDIAVIICAFLSISLTFIDLYFVTYNLSGFINFPKDYTIQAPQLNFALLVFAHNEEGVIETSLQSLFEIDYPKDLYEIFVVADNCTDRTIAICEELQKKHNIRIIVRTNDKLRGKQYAASDVINDFLPTSEYFTNKDIVVFLDADNHVNRQFLTELNSDLLEHPDIDVIQSKLGVKNPNDNVISMGYASTYNVFNRFYQFVKRQVEVNSHIGGTGFALRKDMLLEVGWSTSSLTEDYESAVKYTILGKKIRWNHDAVIYDEKPTEMKVSLVQRLRWVRGHWQVVFGNFFGIVKGYKKMGMLNWIDQLVTAVSLAKSMNYGFSVLLGYVIGLTIGQWMYLYASLVVLAFSYLMFIVQSYYVLTREEGESVKAASIHTIQYAWAAFVYNITFLLLHYYGLFTWRNRTWKRTEHKVTEVGKDEHKMKK